MPFADLMIPERSLAELGELSLCRQALHQWLLDQVWDSLKAKEVALMVSKHRSEETRAQISVLEHKYKLSAI